MFCCRFTKTLRCFFSPGFSAAEGRAHRGAGGGLAWERTDHGRERNGVGTRGICPCKCRETGEKHQTLVRWSSKIINMHLLSLSVFSLFQTLHIVHMPFFFLLDQLYLVPCPLSSERSSLFSSFYCIILFIYIFFFIIFIIFYLSLCFLLVWFLKNLNLIRCLITITNPVDKNIQLRAASIGSIETSTFIVFSR